ncbi:MAG TPA: transposase [Acidimicrobiales bacterium]|nr:transposase [Acidimicrobiales bacterium]
MRDGAHGKTEGVPGRTTGEGRPLGMEWCEARGVSDSGYTQVAAQLGLLRGTLRRWVIEAEGEQGARPGLAKSDRERIAELERENKELRRTYEILKSAAAFFGAELDRRPKK